MEFGAHCMNLYILCTIQNNHTGPYRRLRMPVCGSWIRASHTCTCSVAEGAPFHPPSRRVAHKAFRRAAHVRWGWWWQSLSSMPPVHPRSAIVVVVAAMPKPRLVQQPVTNEGRHQGAWPRAAGPSVGRHHCQRLPMTGTLLALQEVGAGAGQRGGRRSKRFHKQRPRLCD